MKKRIVSILLVFVFAVSAIPLSFAEATDTVGRTTYTQVIKSGKTVFCNGHAGLYKITLKNGKPKKIKKLTKFDGVSGAMDMVKKGKYIYYMVVGTSAGGFIYRINVNTGKKKRLTDYLTEGEYTIANNTLYYSHVVWVENDDDDYDDGFEDDDYYYEDDDDDFYDESDDDYYEDYEYTETIAAKLDGSSPKVVDVKISSKSKKTNSKNYRVYSKRKGRYFYDYLKTPKGKFYIGKVKIPKYY